MNIPYYLEFLVLRISSGGDGILEENVYTILHSVEIVALLQVLLIYHVALCLPLCWLAGKCGDLEEYKFGVSDMPWAVDSMDKAFAKLMVDGSLILDKEFIMKIF